MDYGQALISLFTVRCPFALIAFHFKKILLNLLRRSWVGYKILTRPLVEKIGKKAIMSSKLYASFFLLLGACQLVFGAVLSLKAKV